MWKKDERTKITHNIRYSRLTVENNRSAAWIF